ncbi:MAG: DsbA family protein [Actinomycetota bacterium]
MPKEPRARDNRAKKNSGDTVTRNIVIGMVALVVLSGLIFTVLDKRTSAEVAFPKAIEKIDAANNGAPLKASVLPDNDYGIVFNADNGLQINIWEDFQCPFCKYFETAMSSYIEDLVRNNEAKVVYHMTSFLGQESKRAANAAYCAVDEGRFIEFHRAIYDVQGTENSGIFSNKNLLEIGKRLGITSPTFESCVNDNKNGDVVEKVYSSMAKNKVEGTPTVFINGKLWNRSGSEFVLDEFKAAVEAAKQ